jgi:hypothetical protein
MSGASRGREREHFLELFLYQVFPPTFRFGSGDIMDRRRVRSGQLDFVVEYPFLPSFLLVGPGPRLYLAAGVAAVIEVKSDLQRQWGRSRALSTCSPKTAGQVDLIANREESYV